MVKDFFKKYLYSLIIVTFMANSCFAENDTYQEGDFLPDIHFFDENSEKIYFDQFEGKTILVVFWATWCGTCLSCIPSLDILQKDFHKLPFEVVAISEDSQPTETIKDYFNQQEIRHIKIYYDYQSKLLKEMKIAGLPTAFVVNPEGKIKTILKGSIKWHDDKIRDLILEEISGNPQRPRNSYKIISLNNVVPPKEKITQKNKLEQKAEKNENEEQEDDTEFTEY